MLPDFCDADKWKRTVEKFYILDAGETETAFSGELQDTLFEMEDGSWWFQYRGKMILTLMNKYFSRASLTLDIGAGNGYTSAHAKRVGYKIGIMEPSVSGCRHAVKRGLRTVLCGELSEDSVADGGIEQAMLLDCLEHIEEDAAMLGLLGRKMKKGGRLLLTVPAFNGLWSSADDYAGHFRRYTCPELERKLSDAGFTVLQSSYFMSFLYLPILVVRVWMERLGLIQKSGKRTEEEAKKIRQKQFVSTGKVTNMVLRWLGRTERRWLKKGRKIPFGSSVILVAENKKEA